MRFDLTETQQLLKNSARKFFPVECPIAEVRRLMETDTAHDDALYRKMAEQGWTGILFGEEDGGMGLGMVEMAAAMEEMGRALAPGAYMSSALLAGTAIAAAAHEEQRKKYLTPLAAGQKKATLAILERSANWEAGAVKLEMTDGALDGVKLFVTDAAVADFIVVAARTAGELALVVVEQGVAGLTIKPMPSMDATRKIYEVSFTNTPAEIFAKGPAAERALERSIDVATIGVTAEMAGAMQRMLEITVEYAKTRKQFGKPIGSYQAVQHQCADMLLYTECARSAVYYAAYQMNEDPEAARAAVSVAKAYTSDACRLVGNHAIQVHGGNGFTWDNDLHLYYKRAKSSETMFGDATFHRERIAKLIIDKAQAAGAGH